MPLTTVSQGLLSTDAQYTGFKNRVINGAFLFWQRGTSFTPNPVTYGADRFASFKSGASAGDYARSTDVPSGAGFTYSSYFNNADIRQAIELPVVGNAGDYVLGSTWTVSFWAKVGSGTASNVVGLGFADGTSAGNFGRWGSDQSFNVTTTWQYFSRTFTVSNSPVGSNACVLLYFGASPAFYITGIQVEKGSTATSFDVRSIGTELALCQRYFEIVANGANSFLVGSSNSNSGNEWDYFFKFLVQKRVNPTGTVVGSWTYNNTNAANSYIANSGLDGFNYIQIATATGRVYVYNTGGGYMTFSAEL